MLKLWILELNGNTCYNQNAAWHPFKCASGILHLNCVQGRKIKQLKRCQVNNKLCIHVAHFIRVFLNISQLLINQSAFTSLYHTVKCMLSPFYWWQNWEASRMRIIEGYQVRRCMRWNWNPECKILSIKQCSSLSSFIQVC